MEVGGIGAVEKLIVDVGENDIVVARIPSSELAGLLKELRVAADMIKNAGEEGVSYDVLVTVPATQVVVAAKEE